MSARKENDERRVEFADRTNLSQRCPSRGEKPATARASPAEPGAGDEVSANLELCFELNSLLDQNKELVDCLQQLRGAEQLLAQRMEKAVEATRQLGLEELSQRNAQLGQQLEAARGELLAREGELQALAAQNASAVRELEEKNRLAGAQQAQLTELDRREAELRALLELQGAELAAILAQDRAMEERVLANEQQTAQLRQQHGEFVATKAHLEELLAQTPVDALAEEVALLQQSVARVEADNRRLVEALKGAGAAL